MTCQNLQNKLLNITVLFIWYLLQILGELKKNVTRQTWRVLFPFGEDLFQFTRHFGECLKKMVSHTVVALFLLEPAFQIRTLNIIRKPRKSLFSKRKRAIIYER
jgi:hypothetical protein